MIIVMLPFGLNIWVSNNLKPMSDEKGKIINVTIPKGSSVRRIGNILEQKRLIRDSFFFRYYVMYLDVEKALKYGNYKLDISEDVDSLIEKLKAGNQEKIVLKVIPGDMPQTVIRKIAKLKFIKKSTKEIAAILQAKNIRIGKNALIVGAVPFIRPDTYHLNSTMKLDDVIDFITRERIKLVDNSREVFEKKTDKKLNSKAILEKIILASIVQKEGRDRKERFLISSVFTNRLNRRIRLESCATINYILWKDNIKRSKLTFADLKIKSPYNSYANYGLPPEIISIPSDDSIEAAFFPDKTKYLYFVLQSKGEHHFSKTLAEHNKYKRIYKRDLRKLKNAKKKQK